MLLSEWLPKLLTDPRRPDSDFLFGADSSGQKNPVPGLLVSDPPFVSNAPDTGMSAQEQAVHAGGLVTKVYGSPNMDGANQGREVYQKLGDIIGQGESSGNYEAYNTGTRNNKVINSYPNAPPGTLTDKTINDIIADGLCLTPENKNRTFAVGKYQDITPTLKGAITAMKLTGNEKFTPEMQERIYNEYVLQKLTSGLNNYVNYAIGTANEAQYSAAHTWASVAVPKGMKAKDGTISDGTLSYYGSGNHANQQSTQHIGNFLQNLWPGR